jgi:putative inorganic carbon (HCO3(-)) transporter
VLSPFIAMIVGNVRRMLLTIIMLDIPFQLDTNLRYRTEAAELGAIGGFNISLTTICLAVLYALWLGELLTRSQPQSHARFHVSFSLSLYLAFVVLSVVVAHDVELATFELLLLVQMFLLYTYIANTVRTRQDVLFIVTLLLIGLVLESLIMIGVYFVGQDFSIAGISTNVDPSYRQVSRVGGTLGSPIIAASYLSLLLAPAIGLLLTGVARWYKWLAVFAFSFGAVALILTLSRGGWLALVLSLTVLCLLAWHRGWLSPTIPFALVIVVILLSLLFQNAILTRIFGDDMGSANSRIPLMKLAFRIINDNPVFGAGANNFAIMINRYATPEFGGEWLYVVHNKYLLVWAETGIGGLVMLISFLIATIRRGWQCWKFNDRFLSPLALGFTGAIVGQMAHMFIDVFHTRSQVQLLWLVASLIIAMGNMNEEKV